MSLAIERKLVIVKKMGAKTILYCVDVKLKPQLRGSNRNMLANMTGNTNKNTRQKRILFHKLRELSL